MVFFFFLLLLFFLAVVLFYYVLRNLFYIINKQAAMYFTGINTYHTVHVCHIKKKIQQTRLHLQWNYLASVTEIIIMRKKSTLKAFESVNEICITQASIHSHYSVELAFKLPMCSNKSKWFSLTKNKHMLIWNLVHIKRYAYC